MKIKLKTRADTDPTAGVSKADFALCRKLSFSNKENLKGSGPCDQSKHLVAAEQGTFHPECVMVRDTFSSTNLVCCFPLWRAPEVEQKAHR